MASVDLLQLRHGVATLLLEEGKNIPTLQESLVEAWIEELREASIHVTRAVTRP